MENATLEVFEELAGDIAACVGDDGVEAVEGFFSFVEKIGKGVASAAKAVVHSGITKTLATGLAVVIPATAPLAVGLVVADKMLGAAEGTRGTPKQQAAVRAALKTTHAAASKGDPEAKRTLELLATAAKLREAHVAAKAVPGPPPTLGSFVDLRTGIVRRGRFQQV